MDNSRQNKTDVGSNCSAVFDTEEAQAIHELMKRSTGHDCPGIGGGQCPIMPRPESLTKTAVTA